MLPLEEMEKKKEQEALKLKKAIEHAEQKAADETCSCRDDHKQLATWLKELQKFREEREMLEEPYRKEYRHLLNDLEEVGYLADEMAFDSADVTREQGFVWRSVKEIAFRAASTFKRAKYFEKKGSVDDE